MISNASITHRPPQAQQVNAPAVKHTAVQKKNTGIAAPRTRSVSKAEIKADRAPALSAAAQVPRRKVTPKANTGTHKPGTASVGQHSHAKYDGSFKHAVRLPGGMYLYKGIEFPNRNELKKFQAAEKLGTIAAPQAPPTVPTTPTAPTKPADVATDSTDTSGLSMEAQILKFMSEFAKDIDQKIKDQMAKVKAAGDGTNGKDDKQAELVTLNQLIDQRTQTFTLVSSIMRSLNDTNQSIIRNIHS